ncbi:hypothetical protein BsWGS_27466 [Bradybaena similaris]
MTWKSSLVVCAIIGGLAAATYPIIIAPYLNPKPWKEIQRIGREGIDREKIQPGGMKVWTDPFNSKKD